MPTVVSGTLGTTNILSDQKKIDISDKIHLLQPEVAPLTVLISKLKKEKAINTTYNHLEDDLELIWSNCTNNAGTGTTINVTTGEGQYFVANDLIKVPSTSEVILVSSISTDTLTVVRGYGSTSATSIDGSSTPVPLVRIGNAFEEGTTAATSKIMQTVKKTNYLQIFKKSVRISKTQANVATYGGSERARQRNKKYLEFMRDIENGFLFGEAYEDTGSKDSSLTLARRVTGGVLSFITTNTTNAGGVLTETEFEAFLRSVFEYGSDTRYLFCSSLLLSVISSWARTLGLLFGDKEVINGAISVKPLLN